MATAVLLCDLDNELLIVGDSELLHSEHRALRLLGVYHRHIVLCAERLDLLLLHGGTLHYFLVHYLERYIFNIKCDIGSILQFGVEVKQSVVGIDGFQEELHPETL